MHRFEAEEAFAEGGGEPFVGFRLIDEEGVAAGGGDVERVQEGCPGGLLLVGDVAVPGDGVSAVVEEGSCGLIVGTAVHEVDFGISCRSARCGMDM